MVTRQKEVMKAICTFRLFREKVPLGEALALAAEEQNIGAIILVTYVGRCSFTTRYLCLINTMQVFPIGKQVTLGDLGNVRTYILSVGCVSFQSIRGFPTAHLLPGGRRRGRERLSTNLSFILSGKHSFHISMCFWKAMHYSNRERLL